MFDCCRENSRLELKGLEWKDPSNKESSGKAHRKRNFDAHNMILPSLLFSCALVGHAHLLISPLVRIRFSLFLFSFQLSSFLIRFAHAKPS